MGRANKCPKTADLHDVGWEAKASPVQAHVEVAVAVEVVRTWHWCRRWEWPEVQPWSLNTFRSWLFKTNMIKII